MEQKTLLITGFEPFQQGTINPSWEAVALLPETIGPWRLEKLRLPVVFGKAADLAIARAQQLCPQAILAVGQAGGRGAVTPELVAINTRDAAIPDNEGNAFQGQPVVPGGGDGYFATAPVRQMVQAAEIHLLPVAASGVDMNELRNLGDQLKEKLGEGVVLLASDLDGKVQLMAMATDGAVKKGAHAGMLIKSVAKYVGGGGGGRPNMAQAGGKNPAGIPEALKEAAAVLEGMLK